MTDTAGNVSQFVWYAPYGEALVDEHTTTYENPFKFSGKELDDITGLYDHGARNRNPITAVWYGIDELFEKYPENGPYSYCGGNPVKFVDLDGRDTKIRGPLRYSAVEQLNKSEVSDELEFRITEEGKLESEQICDGSLSEWAQLVYDACADETIEVNMSAFDTKYDNNGHAIVGGAFMGNKKINRKKIAYQLINPKVLRKLSEANNKPGADILHELLEAYIVEKISQEEGYNSPQAGEEG